MIPINIIVAVDKNYGIGKNGQLPWRLSQDLKYFKEITTKAAPHKKNVVIMGRKTWESLPEKFKPLPDRINIVLTRDSHMKIPESVERANSFQEAFQLLETKHKDVWDKVFVIGGAEIYRQTIELPQLQTIFMTHILSDFTCDVFFPLTEDIFKKKFERKSFSSVISEKEIIFYFAQYQKL